MRKVVQWLVGLVEGDIEAAMKKYNQLEKTVAIANQNNSDQNENDEESNQTNGTQSYFKFKEKPNQAKQRFKPYNKNNSNFNKKFKQKIKK